MFMKLDWCWSYVGRWNWNIVNIGLCQIGANTICCGWALRRFFQISPVKNQISAELRYIESIWHWEKFVIFADSNRNLSLYEMSYFLPEVQLSIFIRLIQIVFGYTQLIVSMNRVSNRVLGVTSWLMNNNCSICYSLVKMWRRSP